MSSLNSLKILREDNQLCRDWRGLSSLLNLSGKDQNVVDRSGDKMKVLLEMWKGLFPESNFENLLECLQKIGRYDIYDDVIESLGMSRL